jgi:hypothetical protein
VLEVDFVVVVVVHVLVAFVPHVQQFPQPQEAAFEAAFEAESKSESSTP